MSRSPITYLSRPEPERRRPPPAPTRYVRSAPRSVARGLGWFSLALGAAEWLRPHHAARAAGVPRWAPVVKAWGLREMLVGAGVLLTPRPAAWMWARVAGDVLDFATRNYGPCSLQGVIGMARRGWRVFGTVSLRRWVQCRATSGACISPSRGHMARRCSWSCTPRSPRCSASPQWTCCVLARSASSSAAASSPGTTTATAAASRGACRPPAPRRRGCPTICGGVPPCSHRPSREPRPGPEGPEVGRAAPADAPGTTRAQKTRRAAPGEAARRALAGKTAAPGCGGVRWAGGGAGLPRLRGLARAQYRHEPLAAESPERG